MIVSKRNFFYTENVALLFIEDTVRPYTVDCNGNQSITVPQFSSRYNPKVSDKDYSESGGVPIPCTDGDDDDDEKEYSTSTTDLPSDLPSDSSNSQIILK